MRIIGISGKKGCGKTTVAEIIKASKPKVIIFAFADPLKQEVSLATGFSLRYIEEHKANFRLLLQAWGTDFKRNIFGQDFWIKKMDDALVTMNGQFDTLVIPDVRFVNEYDWVKRNGGTIIRVERCIDYSDNHISETALDGYTFDHTILNQGSIEELYNKVMNIL